MSSTYAVIGEVCDHQKLGKNSGYCIHFNLEKEYNFLARL